LPKRWPMVSKGEEADLPLDPTPRVGAELAPRDHRDQEAEGDKGRTYCVVLGE
jgi:hypothetical protein